MGGEKEKGSEKDVMEGKRGEETLKRKREEEEEEQSHRQRLRRRERKHPHRAPFQPC